VPGDGRLVPVAGLSDLARALLVGHGADLTEAASIARALVWCDRVGRPSQGVWRLSTICAKLEAGEIRSPCEPEITEIAPAAARIDAADGAGHYVAELGALRAIELARATGAGVVTVRGAHHFGAASYYAHLYPANGMIGFVMTNASPKVAAWGGLRPVLGTNPIAFAAPTGGGRSVLVDLSTAAASGATLRWAAQRGELLPSGVAIDRDGQPLREFSGLKDGALLPVGGPKGYALGFLVEILTGVLAGAGVSAEVRSSFGESSNVGQLFIALDVDRFLPIADFVERLDGLIALIRASGPHDAMVRFPGEARWEAFEESASGIVLDATTVRALETLATECGVTTPWE
jgi:LDH2 family malate/lactate/ureidoglycolate dehydrogenase